MLFVELGRVATHVDISKQNEFMVIVGIQDKNFVIVQFPLTMKRQRYSVNTIKLLDLVLPVKESMTMFEVQRVIDSEGAVKTYQNGEEYKRWEEVDTYKNCSDFERFKKDLKRRIEVDILTEKNML